MHISRIDSELFHLIKEKKVVNINIKSVFNTSLSGYSGEYFITLLNKDKELLPMSIVLSGTIDDLSPYPTFHFMGSECESANLFYDAHTVIEDLHAHKEDWVVLPNKILIELKHFLYKHAMKDSFYPLLSRTKMMGLSATKEIGLLGNESFFLEKLNDFLTCLKMGDLSTAPNIIGYGSGLTPSSDDFVLGLLSVYLYVADKGSETLIQYISLHKAKTTEVSKWMLHYASINRLFPLVVKRFFLQNGSNEREAWLDFLNHGGTSGIDLLCGIYTGLFLIIDDND